MIDRAHLLRDEQKRLCAFVVVSGNCERRLMPKLSKIVFARSTAIASCDGERSMIAPCDAGAVVEIIARRLNDRSPGQREVPAAAASNKSKKSKKPFELRQISSK